MCCFSLFIRVCSTAIIYWYDFEACVITPLFFKQPLSCSESIQSTTEAENRGEGWKCCRSAFVEVESKIIREGRKIHHHLPRNAWMPLDKNVQSGVCDSWAIFHALHYETAFLIASAACSLALLLFRHFCTENIELGRLAKRCWALLKSFSGVCLKGRFPANAISLNWMQREIQQCLCGMICRSNWAHLSYLHFWQSFLVLDK